MSAELEDGLELTLDFSKLSRVGKLGEGLVPVVLQHADTLHVLFIGYANERALAETLERKRAVLWSSSRNELWHKGATSGDELAVVDVRVNCEQNSLLYLVRPLAAGVCHTRDDQGQTRPTCYYRRLEGLDRLGFVADDL